MFPHISNPHSVRAPPGETLVLFRLACRAELGHGATFRIQERGDSGVGCIVQDPGAGGIRIQRIDADGHTDTRTRALWPWGPGAVRVPYQPVRGPTRRKLTAKQTLSARAPGPPASVTSCDSRACSRIFPGIRSHASCSEETRFYHVLWMASSRLAGSGRAISLSLAPVTPVIHPSCRSLISRASGSGVTSSPDPAPPPSLSVYSGFLHDDSIASPPSRFPVSITPA